MSESEPLLTAEASDSGAVNSVTEVSGVTGSVQNESHPSSTDSKQDIKSNFRLYLARTIFLYCGYLCLGLNIGEGGPTFLDLIQAVGSDVEHGSIYYTGGSIGYSCGALIAGILYDFTNTDSLLFLALFCLGCLNVALPWCPSLWLMTSVNAIRGATMGSVDVGGTSVCVRMWKNEGSPYLQALHLSFSIGGVIAPFIAEPFLSPKANETTGNSTGLNNNTSIEHGFPAFVHVGDYTTVPVTNLTEAHVSSLTKTRVQFAYLIIGSLTVVSSFPFLVLFLRGQFIKRPKEIKRANNSDTPVESMMSRSEMSLSFKIMFLIPLGVFYLFYVSLEQNIEGYIATFVVKHLDWTKTEGAQITSVFWGTFAAGRLVGVVTSKFLTPWKMLLIDLVLVNSVLIPLWFVTREHDVILWICIPLAGFFMATIFPTGISWTDQRIMKVTGKVTSVFTLSATLGGVVLPILLGYLFENITQMWFVYLMIIEAGACLVTFILITVLLRFTRPRGTYNLDNRNPKRN